VIHRGGRPEILDNGEVEETYSAASIPNEPVGPDSINYTRANWPGGFVGGLEVYKGNFWDENPNIGNPQRYDAYAPLFFGLLTAVARTTAVSCARAAMAAIILGPFCRVHRSPGAGMSKTTYSPRCWRATLSPATTATA